jgi:RimJ/RimL family protein N-acetyltransferase
MREPDLQPTLVGERVTIRPLRADDWDATFAAAADPKIWELHPIRDRYTEPLFRDFFDGALASKAAFAFIDRATGLIFGSSRYHGHDPRLGEIEIGWTFLDRAHWGGAFNGEVKWLMLRHAFGFVETAIFLVGEGNLRSRRAMEKIGGVRREGLVARTLNGATYQHVVYEIRRPDFETGPLCLPRPRM